MGDRLSFTVLIEHIGRTSIIFSVHCVREIEEMMRCRLVMVTTSLNTNSAINIPAESERRADRLSGRLPMKSELTHAFCCPRVGRGPKAMPTASSPKARRSISAARSAGMKRASFPPISSARCARRWKISSACWRRRAPRRRSVVRLVWYVTDLAAYTENLKEIGNVYRDGVRRLLSHHDHGAGGQAGRAAGHGGNRSHRRCCPN